MAPSFLECVLILIFEFTVQNLKKRPTLTYKLGQRLTLIQGFLTAIFRYRRVISTQISNFIQIHA